MKEIEKLEWMSLRRIYTVRIFGRDLFHFKGRNLVRKQNRK